ncbi:MAG: hypothetical protein MJZ69_06765 [Bacteroidaceae bacterium]|nr:hypothetical protein [Bacteroidaceae bacterium]
MKKIFLLFVLFFTCFQYVGAQTIKAGSLISVQSNKEVRAKKLNVGDLVEFEVYEDLKVQGAVAVPKGSKAYAKVLEARKSGIAGTKGKLKIEFIYCQVGETKIPLEGEIDFAGKNRTGGTVAAAAIVAAPLIFLSGKKAFIPEGYQTVATVKVDTDL